MQNERAIFLESNSRKALSFFLFFLIVFFVSNAKGQTLTANAGSDKAICPNDSTQLGGNPAATGGTPPYSYSWQPSAGLNDPAISNPNAFTSAPTIFTLTITDAGGNIAQDIISITHLPAPTVDAGPDQTIVGGANTNLQASGAVTYYWFPGGDLTNANTASPLAEPGTTTTFCVGGADANGCADFDCMIVEVIPSDTVIIYNAFSPNGDGINDVFFIGNIKRFPENKLEVYNRNGKLVFQAARYANDWDGKIEGTELPAATYYVVLNLGEGNGKAQGAVTIIR